MSAAEHRSQRAAWVNHPSANSREDNAHSGLPANADVAAGAAPSLTVQLRYFASVREAMGTGHEQWRTRADTLQALREALRARGEPWAGALAPHLPIRMALNQQLARADTPLPATGVVEVAFFPPVTGG